jgi:hypothetical protein
MAIAFRSTSTGPNSNATTTAIALPAGTTTGDVTVLLAQQASSGATMTVPAGWTALCAGNGVIVCYRVYQAGDPTSGITSTSSAAAFWESLAVTYSGCDTTTPVDASSFCYNIPTTALTGNRYRAPSICPNFNNAMLMGLYSRNTTASAAITLPAGLTSRATTSSGPAALIGEKALTDGTPTGDLDATCTTDTNVQFGMSLVLKAAGAAAATLAAPRPTFGGFYKLQTNTATVTLPLNLLNVQNGDLVAALSCGPSTLQPLAGWTQLGSVQGATVFARTWSTGDTQSPVFTVSGGQFFNLDVVILRRAGIATANVTLDGSGVASGTGTVATPSLTPAGATDLLLTYFGTRIVASGTWSAITAGLSDLDIITSGPCSRFSSLLPAATPSGAFSATLTPSAAVDAFAGLFRVAVAATAGPRQSLVA